MVRTVARLQEFDSHRARLRLIRAHGPGAAPPVLELDGEFDIDTVPEIDRFLRRNLGPLYHQRDLVIDLGGTTFIDSSFIGYVMGVVNGHNNGGRRADLVLASPSGQVRRVLGKVGLPNVVPVYDRVEDAMESLASGHAPVIPPAFTTVPR